MHEEVVGVFLHVCSLGTYAVGNMYSRVGMLTILYGLVRRHSVPFGSAILF